MEQSATKDWELRDNCDRVTQEGYTLRAAPFSKAFTNSGKRCSSGLLAKATGAVITLAVLPDAAIANPQIGPTSSASVGISLSVAPRFELEANPTDAVIGLDAAGTGGFCIRTNGSPTLLPIMLVRDEVAIQAVHKLAWCEMNGNSVQAGLGAGAGVLLIRPE